MGVDGILIENVRENGFWCILRKKGTFEIFLILVLEDDNINIV